MIQTQLKICATGQATPRQIATSSELDERLGFKDGYVKKLTGITSRHYATNESATDLAVEAVTLAIEDSGICYDDIHCIISASGTMEQAIPCNAAKLHARLPLSKPVPAFDINMTCLGSLMALEVAGSMLNSIPKDKYILVYASDIASVGLDWNHIESAGIFGDGAAAYIIGCANSNEQGVIASKFETYSQGIDYCQIKGAGTLNHPSKLPTNHASARCNFEMDGKSVYRLAAKVMPAFMKDLMGSCNLSIDDIDWFVPHQASSLSLKNMRKKFSIPREKFIEIYQNRGNQIAASIPAALDHLLKQYQVNRGDKIMLLGTSAGMSIGAIILQY